jgi:hypothetical protein
MGERRVSWSASHRENWFARLGAHTAQVFRRSALWFVRIDGLELVPVHADLRSARTYAEGQLARLGADQGRSSFTP